MCNQSLQIICLNVSYFSQTPLFGLATQLLLEAFLICHMMCTSPFSRNVQKHKMLIVKIKMSHCQVWLPEVTLWGWNGLAFGDASTELDPLTHPLEKDHSGMQFQLKVDDTNMVTRALEAPDEINVFRTSVSWIFQPSQCFGHEMPWGRAPKHTFNGSCRGFCTSSFPRLYFFWQDLFWSSFLQFRGQEFEQVFVDIVLSPNILICLDEQLWIGQAIELCLYTNHRTTLINWHSTTRPMRWGFGPDRNTNKPGKVSNHQRRVKYIKSNQSSHGRQVRPRSNVPA